MGKTELAPPEDIDGLERILLMTLDPDMIAHCIQSRRTVKPPQYTDQTISRDDMERILELAAWAPTHGKTEPWRLRVYTGETLDDLSANLVRLYHAATPADSVDASKVKKLKVNPMRCSHALLISCQTGMHPKIPVVEDQVATACAVQNMCLMARSLGIASFWSTGPMIYHASAADMFCLDTDETLMGVLYLGYPKSDWPHTSRKPTSDYVRWMD